MNKTLDQQKQERRVLLSCSCEDCRDARISGESEPIYEYRFTEEQLNSLIETAKDKGEDEIIDGINRGLSKWGIKKKLSFDQGFELLDCLYKALLQPMTGKKLDSLAEYYNNTKKSKPTLPKRD